MPPDVVATDLGRLAQDEIVVGREALGTVHEQAHLGRGESGDALYRVLHEDLELVPVLGQRAEGEALRDAVHAPGLGPRVEAAHQEAGHLFLEVDVAVRVAHDGQVGRDAVHGIRDDIHVLAGVERHGDAAHPAELARPHARAVDEDLGRDRALGRLRSRRTPVTFTPSWIAAPPARAPLASA